MNRRIIEKIIGKKFDTYVESIEDNAVKEAVRMNSVITGGSIVSLLLNERVKDYDVYFKDMATVEAVARYYVDAFTGLNKNVKIVPQVEILDSRVKIVVQSAGVTSSAGDTEYQYFENFPDEVGQDYFDKVVSAADEEDAEEFERAAPEYRPVFMSANAITLSGKVQLVIRFYGDPGEIHKNYDFIHCCNYWESNTRKLTLNPAALESILTKTLSYQGSLYPVCSVIRMRKFIKRGWYINAGQILKMLFQVSALDLTDIGVLEDQLTGVDAAYFHQVIDWCKKKKSEDPEFKVTTPYLISIIDKIFG
jgi:hypothetical protein